MIPPLQRSFRPRLLGFIAVLVFPALALAADPSGVWSWTANLEKREIETTLTLDLTDGRLTGTVDNRAGPAKITDASFADEVVRFQVVRKKFGRKFVASYEGKLEGDTITGTISATTPKGETHQLDWVAKRSPDQPVASP